MAAKTRRPALPKSWADCDKPAGDDAKLAEDLKEARELRKWAISLACDQFSAAGNGRADSGDAIVAMADKFVRFVAA